MKRIAWLFVVACSKPAGVSKPAPTSPALNALMNQQVNAAFTRLSFFAFHADQAESPEVARRELVHAANKLAAATSQLREWPDPPVESAQGRDVFHTYAMSLDDDTRRLLQAAIANDNDGAMRTLERIAETCNNCHHFFRLKIEDSVVNPK
jgi:cytochrome c556